MDHPEERNDSLKRLLSTTNIPKEELDTLVKVWKQIAEESFHSEAVKGAIARTVRGAVGEIAPEVFSGYGFTAEVMALARLLAARTGDSNEDVLRKALTLYGLAVDAVEKGNRLAILTPDDEIVRDIEGIGDSRGSLVPGAK